MRKRTTWVKDWLDFYRLGGTIRLAREARRHGLSLVLRDRYLYCLGTDEPMTLPRYNKWQVFMKAQGIKTNTPAEEALRPAAATDTHIGTYKLFRHYREGYNSMGDYACGDGGYSGDVVLVRIDEL